jgi:beta-glucosidase
MCGDIVGTEMEAFGVHLWLAPALNIHRSVLCGRNFEYFSEDPLISGKMAAALTMGVQAHPGCGTTIKHYAANNQEYNRFGNNSHISQRALREIYLKGFGICVKESQPKAVMTSYNLLNGQHTAESTDLCEAILRREWGFEGIIMTDWVVGNGIMNSRQDIHPAVKPQLVAAAGGDLFMPGCKADYKNILKGLAKGHLTRKQLQINATRVYRMAKQLNEE